MQNDPYFVAIYEMFNQKRKLTITMIMMKFKLTYEGAESYLLECYMQRHIEAKKFQRILDEKEQLAV